MKSTMSAAWRTCAMTLSLRSEKDMGFFTQSCEARSARQDLRRRRASFQHRNRRPVAAFVLAARPPRLHRRMLAQMLAQSLAKRAGAEAVDDAHGLLAFQQRPIEEAVRFIDRFVDALSDEVDLCVDD